MIKDNLTRKDYWFNLNLWLSRFFVPLFLKNKPGLFVAYFCVSCFFVPVRKSLHAPFISAFYGRISNYSIGIKLYKFERNKQKLFDAIKNNIYKNKKVSSKSIDFFVEYLLLNLDIFMKNSLEDNITKKFDFICLEHTK